MKTVTITDQPPTRYPVDTWTRWFCHGYIWTWRLLRLLGATEPKP